jgi:hypothetical protein
MAGKNEFWRNAASMTRRRFRMAPRLLSNPFQGAGSARYDGVPNGAIMSQRDFLSIVNPLTAQPSIGAITLRIVGTAALVVLCGTSVDAQVPGDSPNMGIGAAVANTPNRAGGLSSSRVPGGARTDYHGEQQYRETLKRIPDKKASKDPWATIRPNPAIDRHRPE